MKKQGKKGTMQKTESYKTKNEKTQYFIRNTMNEKGKWKKRKTFELKWSNINSSMDYIHIDYRKRYDKMNWNILELN